MQGKTPSLVPGPMGPKLGYGTLGMYSQLFDCWKSKEEVSAEGSEELKRLVTSELLFLWIPLFTSFDSWTRLETLEGGTMGMVGPADFGVMAEPAGNDELESLVELESLAEPASFDLRLESVGFLVRPADFVLVEPADFVFEPVETVGGAEPAGFGLVEDFSPLRVFLPESLGVCVSILSSGRRPISRTSSRTSLESLSLGGDGFQPGW